MSMARADGLRDRVIRQQTAEHTESSPDLEVDASGVLHSAQDVAVAASILTSNHLPSKAVLMVCISL
jgi:hypothetical protein